MENLSKLKKLFKKRTKGKYRSQKYNNQNKNSLDWINSTMRQQRIESVNLRTD